MGLATLWSVLPWHDAHGAMLRIGAPICTMAGAFNCATSERGGVARGNPFTHHERSRFRRVDGRWVYTDAEPSSVVSSSPAVLAAAKPGRNDPCPCGSGQKYKRCHGR